MASELAANTLHAQGKWSSAAPAARGQRLPEIWLYLRGRAPAARWSARSSTPSRAGRSRPSGPARRRWSRSAGAGCRWSPRCPPASGAATRAGAAGRLEGPGKAVWFALRVPPAAESARSAAGLSPEQAVDELEAMLTGRGLGRRVVRADEPGDMSVLSISRHLTIWRRGKTLTWRAHEGEYRQMHVSDLVDIAEQIVCAHEEVVPLRWPAPAAPASRASAALEDGCSLRTKARVASCGHGSGRACCRLASLSSDSCSPCSARTAGPP